MNNSLHQEYTDFVVKANLSPLILQAAWARAAAEAGTAAILE